MSQQTNLTFAGLTLCSPGNGLDGYIGPSVKPPEADVVDASPPGSSGRVVVIVGQGSSENTALRYEFDGMSSFSSDSALNAFLTNAEALTRAGTVGTLQYGILNGGATFSKANCQMSFKSGEIWLDGSDHYFLSFTASFTQLGA